MASPDEYVGRAHQINKKITPHNPNTFLSPRISLENGADLRSVQELLDTWIYPQRRSIHTWQRKICRRFTRVFIPKDREKYIMFPYRRIIMSSAAALSTLLFLLSCSPTPGYLRNKNVRYSSELRDVRVLLARSKDSLFSLLRIQDQHIGKEIRQADI
jgi:hypothetical protein